MSHPDRPPALLGIDLGTASVKVVMTDLDGVPLAVSERDYPVDHPEPGWSQTDPARWWQAVGEATRELVSGSAAEPVAVGFSGQMHGVVLTDDALDPVGPAMLWSDSRAHDELARYDALPPASRARLGNPVVAGMAGPLLAWTARHQPDRLARARWALQPKDWLRAQVTDEVASEPSDASATLLWDLDADGWDGATAEALGIDTRLLPPVLPSAGAPGGAVTARAAEHLGVPVGLPVAAGAADTAAALVGTALSRPGAMQLTIGTGIQIVTPVAELPASPPARPVTHLYRSADPQGWYAMAASLNGGSTLAWVCRVLGLSWPELYDAATLPGRPDDPMFVPHLHGERTPWLDDALQGSWTGLTPRHDRARLARAALEGVAITVRIAAESLPVADADSPVRVAGGGTRSSAWRQLLADALGRPLDVVEVSGASGIGAALLGGRAAGLPGVLASAPRADPDGQRTWSPDAAVTARLAERTDLFRRRVEALREVVQER